jgi:hypothetical protein
MDNNTRNYSILTFNFSNYGFTGIPIRGKLMPLAEECDDDIYDKFGCPKPPPPPPVKAQQPTKSKASSSSLQLPPPEDDPPPPISKDREGLPYKNDNNRNYDRKNKVQDDDPPGDERSAPAPAPREKDRFHA